MIDPYKMGSAGGQCRCVSKCVSKFVDLKEAVPHSLVLKTKEFWSNHLTLRCSKMDLPTKPLDAD